MAYSHEAYRRPHGLDVKHVEIQESPNGFLIPRVIAVSRIAVKFAQYQMENKIDTPDLFEQLVYVEPKSDEPIEMLPFLTREATTIEEFPIVGALANIDAVDDIRNVPFGSHIQGYYIFEAARLPSEEHDAIVEMNKMTSLQFRHPYTDLTSEDLS